MKHICILLLSILTASSAFAQNDDWQTGGGYNQGEINQSQSNSGQYGQGTYNRERNHATFSYPNSTRNSTTLFNGGHSDAELGLQIGYVNKVWTTEFDGYTWKENLWGQENKRLHGFQVGLIYQPCFTWGGGLHTGLLYEGYISEASGVKEMGWDKFYEHNLYLPAHLMYRLPFSTRSSLMLYGGLGFNWAIYGEYREYGHYAYDYDGDRYYFGPREYQTYGRNEWPRHMNVQAEIGANLRFDAFMVSFTYSRGLTNHNFYDGRKTRQDKLAITIAVAFGDDDF